MHCFNEKMFYNKGGNRTRVIERKRDREGKKETTRVERLHGGGGPDTPGGP